MFSYLKSSDAVLTLTRSSTVLCCTVLHYSALSYESSSVEMGRWQQ